MKILKTVKGAHSFPRFQSGLLSVAFWLCVLSLTLTSSSCDKCDRIVCLNEGTCDKGVCICPSGYTGPDCGTKVGPCSGIICLNGGECVNGVCNCPTGYTGSDCGDEKTPATITVTKIVVKKFPPRRSNGDTWDYTAGQEAPDLKVILRYYPIGASSVIHYETIVLDNVEDNTNEYSFSSSGLVIKKLLDNPADRHRLSVYDADGSDADDLMSAVNFFPYVNPNEFPTTITIENDLIHVELEVAYTW